MPRHVIALAALAACGVGDDGGTATADARMVDTAMTNKVVAVTCPPTPAATIMTTDLVDAYQPMTTSVPVDGIVRFVMSSGHDVAPNVLAGMTDPGIVVDYGETKCLQFTQAGTYGFYCGAHSFTGTVTVN